MIMKTQNVLRSSATTLLFGATLATAPSLADVGVGARPLLGGEVIIDGSRKMLDEKWTYWEGPRFASSLPIKWQIAEDPVDKGTVVMTDDPVAAGGKYGTADIVTKKAYRDFRLHIEFLVMKPGGNSGVYLQNRYEIQVLDGDKTKHGMGAIINETESPVPCIQWRRQMECLRHRLSSRPFPGWQTSRESDGDNVFQRAESSRQRAYQSGLGRKELRH